MTLSVHVCKLNLDSFDIMHMLSIDPYSVDHRVVFLHCLHLQRVLGRALLDSARVFIVHPSLRVTLTDSYV